MYKSIKKSFKFLCNECGEFFPTSTEHCDKCGSRDIRKATNKDLSRFTKTHDLREKIFIPTKCILIVLLIIVIVIIGYFLITYLGDT